MTNQRKYIEYFGVVWVGSGCMNDIFYYLMLSYVLLYYLYLLLLNCLK